MTGLLRSVALPTGVALLLVLPSCSQATPSTSAPPADQIAVETVTVCTEPRAAPPLAELPVTPERREAFFSKLPLAQTTNKGGRILSSPRIVGVFFGEDPMQKMSVDLLESYGCTSYWRNAVNEYGVGDALYARTMVLPAPAWSADGGVQGFQNWLSEAIEAGTFGALGDQDVPFFFVPQSTHFDDSDCVTRAGWHSSVPAGGQHNVPYAVIELCPTSSMLDQGDVMARAYEATHELIEAATDPDPEGVGISAWHSLGPGVVAPTVRLPQSFTNGVASDDELADLCSNFPALPLDYPFEVARAYSNRQARAGLDPCGAVPLDDVVVLSTNGTQPAPVNLSSGSSQARLDVFADDPTASFQLFVRASLPFADGPSGATETGINVPLLASGANFLTVHDGDSLPVTLQLTVPMTDAPLLSSALGPTTVVYVELCAPSGAHETTGGSSCSTTVDPIVGLPPFSSVDAGDDAPPASAVDATTGLAVLETSDAVAPEIPDADTRGD